MKIIVKGKREGKTRALIRMADRCNGYIVAANAEEVRAIRKSASEMKCNIRFPLTFDEFIRQRYVQGANERIYIDNLDRCLRQFTMCKIEAATITGDELHMPVSDGFIRELVRVVSGNGLDGIAVDINTEEFAEYTVTVKVARKGAEDGEFD